MRRMTTRMGETQKRRRKANTKMELSSCFHVHPLSRGSICCVRNFATLFINLQRDYISQMPFRVQTALFSFPFYKLVQAVCRRRSPEFHFMVGCYS